MSGQNLIALAALGLLLQATPPATAATPEPAAGMVKNVRGNAHVERGGALLPLAAGLAVLGRDRILTGPDGSAGITLRDDTLLSVGPNSSVALDKFAFDELSHDGAMQASVKRGTLGVISGKLARKSPTAVKFVTPSALLGVRGTRFLIDAGAGEP